MNTNVKAKLLYKTRRLLKENAFIEIVIWEIPASVPASRHAFKYRLALVVNGDCVMRYDNEAGKGDHKHVGPVEMPYQFEGVDKLMGDFSRDVKRWFDENA